MAFSYNRQITLADRKRLPYNEAVILEVLRWTSVTPIPLTHSTTEEVTLMGYHLPKDTWVGI